MDKGILVSLLLTLDTFDTFYSVSMVDFEHGFTSSVETIIEILRYPTDAWLLKFDIKDTQTRSLGVV